MEITEDHVSLINSLLEESEGLIRIWARYDSIGRKDDLWSMLYDLRRARAELTTYCRQGRQVGRPNSDDPLRILNNEVNQMINRLTTMLAKKKPSTKLAPTADKPVLSGALGHVAATISYCEKEYELLQRVLASGEPIQMKSGAVVRSTIELQIECQFLIGKLDYARRVLNKHWLRYQKGLPARKDLAAKKNKSPYLVEDELDYMEDKVFAARKAIKKTRRQLVLASKRKIRKPEKPTYQYRSSYERWTVDDCIAGWISFHQKHNRWPKRGEHLPENELPYYNQLSRVMGSSPMSKMRLLTDIQLVTEVSRKIERETMDDKEDYVDRAMDNHLGF